MLFISHVASKSKRQSGQVLPRSFGTRDWGEVLNGIGGNPLRRQAMVH